MKTWFISVFCLSVLNLKGALHDVPHMTLTGQAILKKPADEIQLKIKVTTQSKTAEDALNDNSIKLRNIIEALINTGLDAHEYETLHFNIHPTYTPYPKNPPPDWQATINGYQVENTLYVHTCQIDKIGKVIDRATFEGATQISDLRFGLSNPYQYRDEALTIAGLNAIHEAKLIAKVTGVELVGVLSLNLSQMRVSSPQMSVACFAKAAADNSTPIEAGDVTIEASVNMVYQIK